MTSEKNKRTIIVGIFIFLGIAIIVVTILTLGGQQKTFQKSITLKAMFDDVQGLQRGGNVWFSGVKIGTVKKISFFGSSQVEADLNIDEKSKEYIRKDAKAKISSDGLIGNKIIVIYGGTDKTPGVDNGDVLAVDKAFSSDEVMNTLQENNKNLLEITADFKTISKRLSSGQGTVGKLLADETLANDLQAVMVSLRRTTANAEKLTSNISSFTSGLNKKGTLANDLLTDTTIFASLQASTLQIQEITKSTNGILNDLKSTTGSLNAGLNDKNAPLGFLLHDQEAAVNLKATLKNLESGSHKLDEDLEALQHNFLLRGFFRKKARNQKDSIK